MSSYKSPIRDECGDSVLFSSLLYPLSLVPDRSQYLTKNSVVIKSCTRLLVWASCWCWCWKIQHVWFWVFFPPSLNIVLWCLLLYQVSLYLFKKFPASFNSLTLWGMVSAQEREHLTSSAERQSQHRGMRVEARLSWVIEETADLHGAVLVAKTARWRSDSSWILKEEWMFSRWAGRRKWIFTHIMAWRLE